MQCMWDDSLLDAKRAQLEQDQGGHVGVCRQGESQSLESLIRFAFVNQTCLTRRWVDGQLCGNMPDPVGSHVDCRHVDSLQTVAFSIGGRAFELRPEQVPESFHKLCCLIQEVSNGMHLKRSPTNLIRFSYCRAVHSQGWRRIHGTLHKWVHGSGHSPSNRPSLVRSIDRWIQFTWKKWIMDIPCRSWSVHTPLTVYF